MEDWAAVKALYRQAADLPPDQRRAFVDAQDVAPNVRAEVWSLLGQTADVLAVPAMHRLEEARSDMPAQIGAFTPLRLLGRGGMGVVWLAERREAGFVQQVALKVISDAHASPALVRRFEREREIQARLKHPNIATLIDGGLTEARLPWFAMEYVAGAPITQWCDQHRSSVADRVRLMVQVLDAIDYAHRNLVIHRDLKPSNVMVGADGIPRLLDFGIAKLIDEGDHTALTGADARLLTPEYASPEQIQGAVITTASDVYSAGVLLFELLVGRLPYRSSARARLAAEIAEAVPERLRQALSRRLDAQTSDPRAQAACDLAAARGMDLARLRRSLDADLELIVATALAKAPERRYRSAAALADDLRCWLQQRPISARAPAFSYRLARAIRRNPWLTGVSALAAVSVVAGVAFSLYFALEARHQGQLASTEADTAQSIRRVLSDMFVDVDPYRFARTELSVKQLLDQALTRVDRDLGARADLQALVLMDLGRAYFNVVDQARGVDILKRSYALLQQGAVTRPQDQLAITLRYAEALSAFGDARAAAPVVAELPRFDGMAEAGTPLWFDYSLLRAQQLSGADSVATLKDLMRHPSVAGQAERELGLMRVLASALSDAGDELASKQMRRDIVQRVRVGGSPMQLARALHNLALNLRSSSESIPVLREAIAIYTEQLGANHLHTLNARNLLAGELVSAGAFAEADQEFLAVIDAQRALNGVHVIASLVNYSFAQRNRRHYREAMALLDEAFARGAAQGMTSESDMLGGAEVGRIECWIGLGEYAEAESHLNDLIALRRRVSGSLAAPLILQSWLHLERGQLEAASASLTELNALPQSGFVKVRALYLTGRWLRARGQLEEARATLLAARAAAQQTPSMGDAWPLLAELELAALDQDSTDPAERTRATALRSQTITALRALIPADDRIWNDLGH